MPGPMPKDPRIRQRQNKAATQATLNAQPEERRRTPSLPKRQNDDGTDRSWHRLTRAWWRDIWRSPMMDQFLDADVHGLYRLAWLIDDFWADTNPKLAGEIRLEQAAYGLTPLDRRRLEWILEKAEEASSRKPKRVPALHELHDDPRKLLSVVS